MTTRGGNTMAKPSHRILFRDVVVQLDELNYGTMVA